MANVIEDRVAALDTRLFAFVESQTSEHDRRSLLAVHDGIATRGTFKYLEIGAYHGGTLQAVLADPRCVQIVSIDSRPNWTPDARQGHDSCVGRYEDNSTERMLELLQSVPGADLSKLETVEASTENIAPSRLARPDFCFIDGEHTYDAALRDARFCRDVMQGVGIIAFHDWGVVGGAILAFLRETSRPRRAYPLMSNVFVVELGAQPTLLTNTVVRGRLYPPRCGWIVANRIAADSPLLAAHLPLLRIALFVLRAFRNAVRRTPWRDTRREGDV